jgi:dihydroorotase
MLEKLFSQVPLLIATQCEDEATILANMGKADEKYGRAIPPSAHATIRSREACLKSSSFAVQLAKKHGTRLHILHITTKEEAKMFNAGVGVGIDPTPESLAQKQITAEACVHHMTFTDHQYIELGNKIKCNPAIKTEQDRLAIVESVRNGRIDIIATDHAPHTREEKARDYVNAPSGLPLVQHSLPLLLNLHHAGELPIETIVERACHAPAICFRISDRGYLDEDKYADVVIVDPDKHWAVTQPSLLYQCAWSPLEGMEMHGSVETTFVNGEKVYEAGKIVTDMPGMRLHFSR